MRLLHFALALFVAAALVGATPDGDTDVQDLGAGLQGRRGKASTVRRGGMSTSGAFQVAGFSPGGFQGNFEEMAELGQSSSAGLTKGKGKKGKRKPVKVNVQVKVVVPDGHQSSVRVLPNDKEKQDYGAQLAAKAEDMSAKLVGNGKPTSSADADLGADARCESVIWTGKKGKKAANDPMPGKKKCVHGKWNMKKKITCPDGIGSGGMYFDSHIRGGKCNEWTSSEAASGTLQCEQHSCINPKTGEPAPTYDRPQDEGKGKRKGKTKETKKMFDRLCDAEKGFIEPFKGVCDVRMENPRLCDKLKARQVCQKMSVLHVNEMSRTAGVLLVKRTSCDSSSGKCSVFKSGECIDLAPHFKNEGGGKRKGKDVWRGWSSSINSKGGAKGKGDVATEISTIMNGELGMYDERKEFAKVAVKLLKKYNNTLPEEYQCSDSRHDFLFQYNPAQKKGKGKLFNSKKGKWFCYPQESVKENGKEKSCDILGKGKAKGKAKGKKKEGCCNTKNKDATLGQFAILNF